MQKLFIDDLRSPPDQSWAVARSSEQAIRAMQSFGCPRMISFDHDLGGDDTAMKVVHWMVEKDLDCGGWFIPQNFDFLIHSANPVGVQNLFGLLNGYLKQR